LELVSPLTNICPRELKVYPYIEAKSLGTVKVPVWVVVGLAMSGTPPVMGVVLLIMWRKSLQAISRTREAGRPSHCFDRGLLRHAPAR
jgi:hypothetical protein